MQSPALVGAGVSPSVWPCVCSPGSSCSIWRSLSPGAPISIRAPYEGSIPPTSMFLERFQIKARSVGFVNRQCVAEPRPLRLPWWIVLRRGFPETE